eukprot:364180-Chlamydomonas_euryale.AAC.1
MPACWPISWTRAGSIACPSGPRDCGPADTSCPPGSTGWAPNGCGCPSGPRAWAGDIGCPSGPAAGAGLPLLKVEVNTLVTPAQKPGDAGTSKSSLGSIPGGVLCSPCDRLWVRAGTQHKHMLFILSAFIVREILLNRLHSSNACSVASSPARLAKAARQTRQLRRKQRLRRWQPVLPPPSAAALHAWPPLDREGEEEAWACQPALVAGPAMLLNSPTRVSAVKAASRPQPSKQHAASASGEAGKVSGQ